MPDKLFESYNCISEGFYDAGLYLEYIVTNWYTKENKQNVTF